ncbi:MAG: hypothetical protein JST39_17410 [Bacteroidetes bacterium]|nr:hypothetical protein [Bacteroidota bacterium]
MSLSCRIYSVLLSVAAVVLFGHSLMAQAIDENDFTIYTKQEGLPTNNITGLAQDASGYIWIATSSGLNRFDGSSFLQFHSSSDSSSIPAEALSGLIWLDKNHLAASSCGLHIVDVRTGQTRNLFVPYEDRKYLYKFNAKILACRDTAGNTYLMSHGGFYHFDKDYHLVFRFDYYTKEQVVTEHFGFSRYLTQLDQQHMLLTGPDGNYFYDAARHVLKRLQPADCPLIADLSNPIAADFGYFQLAPGRFIYMNCWSDSIVYVDMARHMRTV